MKKSYSPSFKAQVVLEMLKEEKSIAQIASEYGIQPTQLHKWKKQVLEGLPALFADDKRSVETVKGEYEAKMKELYAEIGRLTTHVEWFKKKVSELTWEQRRALVDMGQTRELSIKTQAALLGLNRSGLYYRPVRPSVEELALKNRIDEFYTKRPYYGSRRIAAQLRREGLVVNRKAIQRHMREMGIAGICPGSNLSKRHSEHQVYPYLLRGVTPAYRNHVWGVDITYIRLKQGWMYLVAIIDWYSRYVVAWELEQTLETAFVMKAARRALTQT